MGLLDNSLGLFAKFVEWRQKNPKKAMLLLLLLGFYLYKLYQKLTQRPQSLNNKVILVTGGAMGIGRLVCELIKRKYPRSIVIVWDINDTELEHLRNNNIVDCAMNVNVAIRDSVMKASQIVYDKYNHIDVLVNNAGIVSGKPLLQLTEKDIRRTFDVNVIAHFWTLQAFLPSMIKRNKGHIVTIASTAGKTGVSFLTDYCASKFACRGLDDAVRHELQDLGHTNIQLTCINPYFINTGMFEGAQGGRYAFLRLFAYFLKPERVAREIVEAIEHTKREIILPYRLGGLYMLEPVLPYSVADFLIVNSSQMSGFVGRSRMMELPK